MDKETKQYIDDQIKANNTAINLFFADIKKRLNKLEGK